MKAGIVGLPNAGKSTIFSALSKVSVPVASHPFTTIEPHHALVPLKDKRLKFIARCFSSAKITPATLEFVDIAGLVEGAHRGEGLGNKFLSHIRDVDLIIHVIRVFEDPSVAHPMGGIDPFRDAEVVETELMLADLEQVERNLEKLEKAAKAGDREAARRASVLKDIKEELNQGRWVFGKVPDDIQREYRFLSAKPVLYVLNTSQPVSQNLLAQFEQRAKVKGGGALVFNGKLELELNELSPEEAQEVLREYGFEERGLDRLVRESFRILNLITFFTANENEARAWPVVKGTTAWEAAGLIHSDFQKKFIKAEVVNYSQMEKAGGWQEAKAAGLVRFEGKEYIIKEGDIIYFHIH